MSKHTAGPWNVSPSYGGGTIPLFFDIVCKAGHDIGMAQKNASPYDDNEVRIEEAEANARLMAAAPELLEALRSLVHITEASGLPSYHGAATAYVVAVAAIAKATGATQ